MELAAVLVVLVLLGAGVAWLWERGWLLWRLLATSGLTGLARGVLRWRHRPRPPPRGTGPPAITPADPTWAPQELTAWTRCSSPRAAAAEGLGGAAVAAPASPRTSTRRPRPSCRCA